uniref:Auxin efflux carrier component n=1 Tax=Setaria italica TaxID=4555 RepID=K4AKH2_SETIT
MRFWSLLIVAWLPVLQVLLVGLLGALLASHRFNVLTSDARRNINKIVYIVFVPSLVFSSLASTVTLKDIISWWFMPVNMGIIFLFGAVLGWVSVKAFRPREHLQGLVIASCSSGKMYSDHRETKRFLEFSFSVFMFFACSISGNWGTIPLMIVPAICNEEGSPFGDANTCNLLGLSYVSLSMALGSFYIWTHSYSVMKRSAKMYKAKCKNHAQTDTSKEHFGQDATASFLRRANDLLVGILKELWSPPSIAADNMKSLVTEEGIGKTMIEPIMVISIIVIRYIILPACGIGIVTVATKLGVLPRSPLYRYVLLLQSTVPPAMSIGTIAQLFDVGEEECSIIFLWTHLVAALALTLWSTVFMSLVL